MGRGPFAMRPKVLNLSIFKSQLTTSYRTSHNQRIWPTSHKVTCQQQQWSVYRKHLVKRFPDRLSLHLTDEKTEVSGSWEKQQEMGKREGGHMAQDRRRKYDLMWEAHIRTDTVSKEGLGQDWPRHAGNGGDGWGCLTCRRKYQREQERRMQVPSVWLQEDQTECADKRRHPPPAERALISSTHQQNTGICERIHPWNYLGVQVPPPLCWPQSQTTHILSV